MFTVGIREVDALELAQWLSSELSALRVVDVRQMQEMAGGMVPGAEAMPLHVLPERIGELSPSERLVVVCRSGARSMQACLFLQQRGFVDVHNLRGGMIGWAQCGLPVHMPGGA